MSDAKNEKFIELLESQHTWPEYFPFKFIMKVDQEEIFMNKLRELEGVDKLTIAASKTNKYKSISFQILIERSHEVIAVYAHFEDIPGMIRM